MWADQEKRVKIRAVVDSLRFIKPRVFYADQVFLLQRPINSREGSTFD
jgi:hypothetical protein